MYSRTIALKSQNPKLKVLLGLGGWNHGPESFSKMIHNDVSRSNFVQNTVNYLKLHKFDGLDLDYEYPGSREGSQPTDKPLFTKLVIVSKYSLI